MVRERYVERLDYLRSEIEEMGKVSGEMLVSSIKALETHDVELAEKVI